MSLRSKILATVSVLALLVAAISGVVHSSFTATAMNEGNSFETGSVSLTGNDSEQVLFDLDGLEPATPPAKRCLTVSYGSTGGLRSSVRLFGETSGALAEHLRLKVHRGSFAGTKPTGNGCDGFTKSSTVFDGTLAGYPDRWEDGIVDPDPSWEAGDSAVYQLEVSLAGTDAAQGKSATQAFAFEARTS
jgi:hypothetical protein